MTTSTTTPSNLTPLVVTDAVKEAIVQQQWRSPLLRQFISELRATADWRTFGAAIADGLPVERDPAERALLELSGMLGPLLPQDAKGSLIREVRYKGTAIEGTRTGRYSDSKDGGDLHTDGPHRPQEPPAAFALLCIRQAESGGALLLVSTAEILSELTPESIAVLQLPVYFDQREEGRPPVRRAVLTRTFDGWQVAYLRGYIDSAQHLPGAETLTATQRSALDELDRVIARLAVNPERHAEVKLRPGQLVFVDNRSVIHGRTAFVADDNDRLMLRTWIGEPGS